MAKKYELISDLYEQISIEVTRDPQTWRLFLKTACRNYKLRFDEQLLLFAQRPDAIAVLEIERWNTAFGRWVNRGAKGIAVFEDSTGESQRLKYYFDIADTHGTEQSREVPVWKMSEEYQSDVAEALKNAFGTSTDSDDLRIVIKESVVNAVDDNIDDYIYGFVKSGTGSEIDYMKPEDAEEIYKRIVTNSVVYMIYERLGMDNLLTDDDFNGIEYFSTPELLNSIGYATGDIARMGLGIVSKTIRSTKKEKQQVIQPVINKISDNERSSYNERNHLHNAGRLSDSGSDITDTTGSYSRQMGRDEERISEAASQSNVLQSDDKRSVDAVSRRRGTESTEAGGQTDERNVGNTGADGRIESKRHDEMGTADEQSAQRSAGDSYSADNNERLSNYKPLPSIEEQTAFIEEFKAEVAKASAFSIPNEIINDHLANGSGFRDGKYRIYEQFRKSLSQKENADFLKNEYGIGGGTHAGGVSGYYYDHNAKGICISKGFADNATRINLNWLEVAKRIQLLINNDRYLNEKEKEHYAQWLNEREERQYTEQGLSTSENKDNEKYIYKVGDTVFIGASEYRITAKDDQQVMLSDANAPLFNKQYDIADFEHKIKENALNEHLKVILSEEESNTSVISETNTTPINDDDYYFNDAERKEVVAVYYNPDAISGGQFVFAHITYELISKAKDVASDMDSFYEYLDENAYTELIDVGTEEYRTVLSEYSDPNPDFIGRNEENMLQLIALAKNEKITYDKNGYHADDLDEGDLIKVDGEIWAVKSVSSYSISLINESGDKKFISNSPDSKWQETLVSRYNFEFIGNREGTNTQVNNESTDSKQLKTAHEHKKNRKQNNAPSVLYPEINNDYRTNFHIDTDELGAGTPLERYYNNINAIRLLKKLNSEHRLATPTEQVILSQYVGWGGLPQFFEQSNSHYNELKDLLTDSEYTSARESTLTAFYTPPTVISAVYKVLENMNFKNGNLLEPSCGIGNFIGMLPITMHDSKIYGVELDTISAGIAQQLYQKSSIAAQGFENVNIPDSFFDGVVGNVPFGDFKVVDKKYDKHNFLIHDYFFAKSLDKLRPGGVMALITSKGTMDKENSSVRKYIAQRAELLGAIRLPNDTFKSSAGTEVVSDILFLQKRDRLIDIEPDWVHLDTNENGIRMNSYFVQNPEMVLGEMKTVSGRFGQQVTCEPYTDSNLADLLSDAIANIHGEISDYENDVATDELEEDMSIPADASVKNFSYSVVNDKLYFRENSRMIPVTVSATAESRIKGLIIIRDCTRNLIELQADDYPEEDIKAAQELLNAKYDNFTEKYGLINSRANKSAFSDDSSFALVSALEILGDEGQLERKADIFFKRTIMPHKPITQVDTASEALAVSIGEKACIDMEYMQSLTGKEENELFNDLKGVIFLNPLYEGNNENLSKYFTADEYLSGNVREKLAIARNSAKVDSRFNINVEALEKVQPEDLTASEISVRLGSTWLPVDIVQQFIYEFLNTPGYAKSSIIVHYSKYTGEWSIDGKLYTIQRYLQYDTLLKNDLQHFDSWASTFGETVTAIELTPEGTGYRAKTRFAKFFNLPELMSMFKEVADIRTADMLELPVPKANFHNIAVKPSEIQKDMVAKLAERAELVRKGNVDASVDNMLKITNDGRKLALDQRMLNEMLPDFEGSKINACIDNIYRIWEETADKKSAQLVFCDLSTPKNDGTFSVYNDIRKKLIERGIPESEVRFIHEADTDVKKKELFQKTRKGEVRVLLGSTQKMGAGTNVQDRLIALHDIDCPWRPSDLEQRAGRIIRQGNSNPEVEIYRYVTEQTFDAYLYQLVEGKQKFASQIMTSKSPVRSADDIDETALSYAEIKMLATGNPYIKEKMDLDIQIQKLKLLKANYLSEKYNLEDKIIKFYPQKIASLTNTIKALEQDLSTAKAHPKPIDDSFVGMEINGEYITEKSDAGKAILESCKQMNSSDPIKIGKYRGFDMELQLNLTTHFYEVLLKSATTQKVSLGDDPNGNITRIDNAIGRIPDHIENAKAELKNIQTQYETAQIEVQKPFAQEEELKAKTKRQIEVEKLISSGENEPEQNAISDYYYFSATDEQINALNNASIPFEKQTKADGSMVIRVATNDKSKAETIMNTKNIVL